MIPGSNLFNQAIKLIKPVEIGFLKFNSRSMNLARQYVPTFDPLETITASVQAVNNKVYKTLELDFKKSYLKIFAASDLVSLERGTSGDRFVIGADLYQMIDDTNWFVQDGWASCIAVKIGAAP